MKKLVLIVSFCVLIIVLILLRSSSTDETIITEIELPEILIGKEIVSVGFPLKQGYQLYMEYDAQIVPQGKLWSYDVSRERIKQINSSDDLTQITDEIKTEDQALSFVQFFTSDPTRFLLKPNPFFGIEMSAENSLKPEWVLSPATIEQTTEGWIIERDLVMYPRPVKFSTAQLVRSREVISPDGIYTFDIGSVIAEGDDVNGLLPYYD